ncbi:MAG: hypothetical protein Q4B58_06955 [Bacteroidales bacterium]|nr:hypothetical protein [Bacteroidales bacterium]
MNWTCDFSSSVLPRSIAEKGHEDDPYRLQMTSGWYPFILKYVRTCPYTNENDCLAQTYADTQEEAVRLMREKLIELKVLKE